LTNDDIRNSKAYKEYYACATGEAAPKLKASAKKKTSGSASSTTPPTPIATPTPTTTIVAALRLAAAAKDVERTKADQLKIVLKRSRQETHISQQHGSGTDEGTGSRPGVPDVPSDDSEKELSWDSSDDEDVDEQTKGREESEGNKTDESNDDNDDDDDEEETTKIGEQEVKESDEGDDEATESDRENDDNNEEDQGLRIGEEERMQEEEDAEELYRDVDINPGWGLQVSQETEDTHVILTPTQLDAQQESSSTLSFMTNLLNLITDPGLESLFTTGSTTVTPIPSPQSTMTPSIMSTFTSASQLPTPPTQIPSLDLQSLPTFASVFRFEDRVKSLEDNFSNIPGIALVEAYDADKTILDTYGESTILKQRREDDDQEGPSTGSDRGSKRHRKEGEHASASTPSEPATGSAGRTTTGSQSRQLSASESAFAEEPVQPTCQMEKPSHPVFETGADDQPIVQTSYHPEWFSQPSRPPTLDRDWNKYVPAAQGEAQSWISALAKQTDARSSFNELLDTPIDFSNFIINRLGVDTLTPELLAGPIYELIRGSCNSLTELEYHFEEVYKATTDHHRTQVYGMAQLQAFRLDIGKLSNLTVEEHFAFNVSLRMFTRSIIIQRRVEDLQLGVESYQKRLNLTKPDTYRSDLKRREPYTAYSNPRGFIYQNKDKKNRLMRIDELHKFSDGTLNDVRNALDDHLKGIRMQYLPTTIWRKGDKARAAAMIQAIGKLLKTKRIIRSLERFFYRFAVNRESALDVYSKRRIITVTELKIVEWHNYKHLDWISVRRDDDKIYKFKEGDLKRLRLQDIKDMLLLLVQGKLSNLTVEERFAFNKRLNLTKPDTYRSDLKRRKAYTAYSNPRGFIYQNKDKKNRLMRIDELHKFSDGRLNDVRNALDDRLKGIRMQYLPTTIWSRGDKDRVAAMIQAIDKMLKTRRIMRSLE
nr:hypothetical protein [Tanacetum cinerariifolium]